MRIKLSAISTERDVKLKDYEILTNTYDHRLTSIQTIVIIVTTFASAVLVVLCSQFNIFDILFGAKPSVSHLKSVLTLSSVGAIQGLCSIISIHSMMRKATQLREVLYQLEQELHLVEIHKKNDVQTAELATIFCFCLMVIAFAFCIFRCGYLLWH